MVKPALPSLAALVVAAALAAPAAAHAYGVEGARLVRLSVLVAWRDGHEVLAVSPVVRAVGGAGRLVVPLPPGGRIVPVPPGWPAAANRPAIAADAGAPPPDRALAPRPGGPRGRAGGRVPVVALPPVAPPEVAFAEPVHVGFLPPAKLRGVPRAVLADYAARGWRFAAITLPEAAGPTRVGAVAFAFPAKRPLLPLRLAEALPAHTLDLTVLAAGPIPDLGGMDFALGLARAPGGPVSKALARWAEAQVGLAVPVRSDFAAPSVNGPLRPLMRFDGDLTLPPPKAPAAGAAVAGAEPTPAPGPAAGPGALGTAPGGAREGLRARDAGAAGAAASAPRGSGCGACAAAGGGAGGDAAILLLGAVALAGLRRRRS